MTEVLDRQARYDAMVADPGREMVATRADRPLEDEGLHKIVVAAARQGWSSSPGSAITSAGADGRVSRWWKVPGHIFRSRCCMKRRRAAARQSGCEARVNQDEKVSPDA